MLNKDSVRARLDAEGGGLSFAEFSYQAFQGADFLRLHSSAGCWAQLGGADQWGNITAGVDLVRRVPRGCERLPRELNVVAQHRAAWGRYEASRREG